MKWIFKLLLFILLLIPSFTSFSQPFLTDHRLFKWTEDSWIVYAPSDGQLLYFLIVLLIVPLVLRSWFAHTSAVLISLSIVFLGALISSVSIWLGYSEIPTSYYVAKLVNIMTVVPLSIALVSIIPFSKFEKSVLSSKKGVSFLTKMFLISIRVGTHVQQQVLPSIWTILREERINKDKENNTDAYLGDIVNTKNATILKKIKEFLSKSLYIAASAIAYSLENIPLWAVEIAQLPSKRKD